MKVSPAELKRCYEAVFGTADGKIVLRDILYRGFVLRPLATSDSIVEIARNEGARQLALMILKKLKTTETQIIEDENFSQTLTPPL